jgi:hypothetical protein
MTSDHSTDSDPSRAELVTLRMDYANLLAAARAAVTAAIDGEPTPLAYLIDELTAHDQLPPQVREQYGNDPLAAWLDHSHDWAQR